MNKITRFIENHKTLSIGIAGLILYNTDGVFHLFGIFLLFGAAMRICSED